MAFKTPEVSVDGFVGQQEGQVYARWLDLMNQAGIAYVVGGAFAVFAYTGIQRITKDLDIFIKPEDLKIVLDTMVKQGFAVEITDPHWLAKIRHNHLFMDCLFGISNHRTPVNETFLKARQAVRFMGVKANLITPEELIVSKMYIAKSYRFDAGDILHVIHSLQGRIDWQRILTVLGGHGELLLWYLLLFNFVYPQHPDWLPQELMIQLFDKVRQRWSNSSSTPDFRGMYIDPGTFAIDCDLWGYRNAHSMSPLVNAKGELV
jgi:hypothetical protein